MEGKNNAEKKSATKNNETHKKVAERRKEWSKEWELEKQTEGLDDQQGEAE